MIKENIRKIRERIALAASRINAKAQAITVVAISKGRSLGQIKEVIEAGITDIGENKVREALIKYNNLQPETYGLRPVTWHMVGHLQTNKVKDAVKIFDLIQSVDSLHLAEEIDKQAGKINKIQNILIEVNTSGERTKFGLKPTDTIEVIKEIARFKNINIKGLMTIAPVADSPQEARPYFRRLKELLNELNVNKELNGLSVLSMGMTDDFEVAIEEGANMVRIGRAIFEG